MREKNEENQVAIITKEWEMTKDYIFEVAMKHGLINLDWHDFENFAYKYKPLLVKVSAVIISMAFKPSSPMAVDEMNGMNANLDELTNQGTDILWGLREDDGIPYERSATLYVFA